MADGETWTCGKDGCTLDVDGHSLALAIEHIYEMDADEADGIAERTMDKLADTFGVER